jgi:REP element-mobilizing transposase RayT
MAAQVSDDAEVVPPLQTARPAKLWQRDFWDRQLRSGDSYSEKWDYVHHNPVRASLVTEPDEWKFQGEMSVLRWHA